MRDQINLYGPPGTGKTTKLTGLAQSASLDFGPHRVGAVTYTRTAAQELRGRIASKLGMRVPAIEQDARKLFDRELPWIGTIHALCYKLLGFPAMVSTRDLNTFASGVSPHQAHHLYAPSPEYMDSVDYPDLEGKDEVEVALNTHAAARHRLISFQDTWANWVPEDVKAKYDEARLARIAREYERYKTDTSKIDFEDMLMLGRDIPLPVSVLLCDEVQDNSALLWSVLDAWSKNVSLVVRAGDPWQAIYLFTGGAPELFRNQPGRWATIGDSRRLTPDTAAQALRILRMAGYEHDDLLKSWNGIGLGEPVDGTRFVLARTNALLNPVKEHLEREGEPYRLLRGTGPLQTNAAKVFRAVMHIHAQDISWGLATQVLEQLPIGSVRRDTATRIRKLAKQDPEGRGDDPDVLEVLDAAENHFPHAKYFRKVYEKHGTAGLVLLPKTAVGTIHGAKGREADEVTLVKSWGFRPARNMEESRAGRRAEACVAYVAATRHRTHLDFLSGPDFPGIDYPF